MDGMEDTSSSPGLGKKILAVIVFAIAAWILLKFAIGLIAGLATIIVIVLAIAAIVWAVRTL
ncbi:hypothetical protein DSM104329_02646 [Capillimicrobium parvum]|uniref:Uncharacterized protein n=2 Tax=Capillimicrobium parvum TaxID=2884022 RepID=A0A9E6XXM1_9ACTN|nr:hypothetical protein DSM104329_02646 [Capillimicrobium parvum]